MGNETIKLLIISSIHHPQIAFEALYLCREFSRSKYISIDRIFNAPITCLFRLLLSHKPNFRFLVQVLLALPSFSVFLATPMFLFRCMAVALSIIKSFKITRHTVIYAHWLFPAGAVGLIISRITGCKLVSAAWGYDIQYHQEFPQYGIYDVRRLLITKTVIHNSDVVIINHKVHKLIIEKILRQSLPRHTKVIYIRRGIYDFLKRKMYCKRLPIERLIPSNSRVVLYSPSLSFHYDIIGFIRAAKIVADAVKNVYFIVVGEGPQKDIALRLCNSLQLRDKVLFLGRVSFSSMLALYSIADIVFDSSYFGNGITTLEAFCFGKPVISIAGIKRSVIHGFNGFMIKAGDYRSLAHYVIELLSNDRLYSTMSQNARRTFEVMFSFDKRIHILTRIMRFLIH